MNFAQGRQTAQFDCSTLTVFQYGRVIRGYRYRGLPCEGQFDLIEPQGHYVRFQSRLFATFHGE